MLPRLKTRAAFVAGNASRRRWVTDGLVLQVIEHAAAAADSVAPPVRSPTLPPIRVGFTATRKLGNAVVRNRVKRRLRALAEEILPDSAISGCDYVLIGRDATFSRPWPLLRADLLRALSGVRALRPDPG